SVFTPVNGPAVSNTIGSETNELTLTGTWFFGGLSDDEGPRTGASFVDRASSLSLRYADASSETDALGTVIFAPGPIVTPTPNPTPTLSTFDVDTRDISLSGRYVWKQSGWFVSGQYSDGELDGFSQADITLITAGVGKYIGKTTSIDLVLIQQDVDFGFGDDADSGVALSGNHIGNINDQWQYGISASVSSASLNGASGSYTTRFSLYPNRDLFFDVGIRGELGGGGSGTMLYDISAGWFVTPQLQGRVGFGFVDEDNQSFAFSALETETDSTNFSASIRYRF
ncbi:MAG: hypothetical protein AAF004_12860, partial [Pseudomonadota bacterium]